MRLFCLAAKKDFERKTSPADDDISASLDPEQTVAAPQVIEYQRLIAISRLNDGDRRVDTHEPL